MFWNSKERIFYGMLVAIIRDCVGDRNNTEKLHGLQWTNNK